MGYVCFEFGCGCVYSCACFGWFVDSGVYWFAWLWTFVVSLTLFLFVACFWFWCFDYCFAIGYSVLLLLICEFGRCCGLMFDLMVNLILILCSSLVVVFWLLVWLVACLICLLAILLTLWLILVTCCFVLLCGYRVLFVFRLILVDWSCVVVICSVVCLLYLLIVLCCVCMIDCFILGMFLVYCVGLLLALFMDWVFAGGLSLTLDVCVYILLCEVGGFDWLLLLLDFAAWFTGVVVDLICFVMVYCFLCVFLICGYFGLKLLGLFGFALCRVAFYEVCLPFVCIMLCWLVLVICFVSLIWICVMFDLVVDLMEYVIEVVNSNGTYLSLALDLYY